MTQSQTPQRFHDALTVVENPQLYAHRPSLRLAAWVELMQARGNLVLQHRLNRAAMIPAGTRPIATRARMMNAGGA